MKQPPDYANFAEAKADGWLTYLQGDFRCLSNFWYAEVNYRGINFPSNEHAFVAAKSKLRNAKWEKWVAEKVLTIHTVQDVKRFGRSIELRENWEDKKFGIMNKLVLRKFEANKKLRKVLLSAPKHIMEGNTWGDRVWGVIETKAGLEGNNGLGKALMKARKTLRG